MGSRLVGPRQPVVVGRLVVDRSEWSTPATAVRLDHLNHIGHEPLRFPAMAGRTQRASGARFAMMEGVSSRTCGGRGRSTRCALVLRPVLRVERAGSVDGLRHGICICAAAARQMC